MKARMTMKAPRLPHVSIIPPLASFVRGVAAAFAASRFRRTVAACASSDRQSRPLPGGYSMPHPHLRRVFAVLALGLLPVLAGQAQAQDITATVEVVANDEIRVDFSAPVNVAASGETGHDTSALNHEPWRFRGARLFPEVTITPNSDGTAVTFQLLRQAGIPIIADPILSRTDFVLLPGPSGLSVVRGTDTTRRVRGFSVRVSPLGPEAELTAALDETNLDGAAVTVELTRTTFESFTGAGAPVPADFTVTVTGGGSGVVDVTAITRVDGDTATLTLGYDGAGLAVRPTLSIVVPDSAHTEGGNLTTNTVPINTAPTITNPGRQRYVLNEAITPLGIAVGDDDRASVTITVAGLPSGLTFSSISSNITGTPDTEGESEVTITADDTVNDPVTAIFPITVDEFPAMVTVASPTGTVAEAALNGTLVTLTLSEAVFTDPLPTTPPSFTLDEDSVAAGITVAATPAPARLSDTQATFTLAYTAVSGGLAGNIAITVTVDEGAHDSVGFLSTEDPIAVIATDQPPMFAAGATIPDQFPDLFRAYNLTLPVATGGNGALAYTLVGLPNGLTFNPGSRTISGAGEEADAGRTYTYRVHDSDSNRANSDSDTLDILLRVIEPASFVSPAIPRLIYLVNEAINITLPAASAGLDPLVHSSIADDAFPGLSFDPATRVISGSRPTAGAVPLDYRVTDARGVSLDFSPALTLTIEADTVPAFTQGQAIADLTFLVGTAVSVTLPEADPDSVTVGNRPFIYRIPPSSGPLPSGLMFNEATRVLSGTPDTVAAAADYLYRARDRDGDFSISAQDLAFTITIEEDLVPDFTGVTIDDVFITRLKPITPITLPEANGGNGDLTYSVVEIDFFRFVGLAFDAASRVISGTATNDVGTRTSAYRATDADGDVGMVDIDFTFEADLVPTYPAVPAQEYVLNRAITPLSLPATGGNRGLTYVLTATPALPAGLTFNDPASAGDPPTITGTPTTAADAETYTITATDDDGSQVSTSFTIAVAGPSARITSPTPLTATEATLDGTFIVVTLTNTIYETLVIGPHFTLDGASGFVRVGGTTRLSDTEVQVRLAHNPSEDGELTRDLVVTVIVADAAHTGSGDLTTTNSIAISRRPDLAPSFGTDTIDPQTYTRNTAISVTLPAATGGDPPLSYTIENQEPQILTPLNLPAGLTFTSATRVLDGTPVNLQTTPLNYVYRVNDGDETTDPETATLAFTITIVEGDIQPTFGSREVGDLNYTVNTAVSVTLPEATGGNPPLTHMISTGTLPAGLTFDATSFVVAGTPTAVQAQTAFTWTVTDSDTTNPDSVDLDFTITIAADTTPTFGAATIADQTYTATVDVGTVTLPTATGGNRTLAYTLAPALPANLVFDGAAVPPTITGAPVAEAASAEYTYTATDDDGSAVNLTFNLLIHPQPVVIGGALTGTIAEGTTATGGTLTITNPNSGGSILFTPLSQAGTYGLFTLIAGGQWSYNLNSALPEIDALNIGDSLMDTFTVTAAAAPPTVTRDVVVTINGINDSPTGGITAPAGDMTVAHGTVINLIGAGTDVDNDDSSLTFTWSTGLVAIIGSFGDASAAETTWTAPTTDTTVVLTLTIGDGSLGISDSVTITVVATVVTFGGDITGDVTEDAGTTTATGTLTLSNSDPAGSTDVVAQTDADGMYGAFTITAPGVWTYTLNNADTDTNALAAGATADDVFTVAAVDGGTQAVTITVTGANDAPTALIATTPAQVGFGAGTVITGSGTDPDTGTTLTYAWSTRPPNTGSFSETTTASTTWTAPTTTPGPVTLILTVTDDATPSLSDTAEATVNLIAPVAAISATVPDSLTEANLDGAMLTVTLTGATYEDPLPANPVTLNTAATDAGVTVTAVRVSATEATLTLAHDGTDFDTDLDIIVTVADAAHAGAGDLDTGTVTVTAVAENNNADLSALTLSAGTLTPDFDAATTTYAAMVDNSVSSLTLTPTVANAFATITVDSTAVTSGMASGRVDLVEGANAIDVVVTATDGSTTQTYTVTVTRAAASGEDFARILATNPSPLTEANLNGATVTVTLFNTEYVAAGSLEVAQFLVADTLSGTVTVSMVSRTDATNAVLTLAYDGTDFDTDGVLNFTVLAAAHTGSAVLIVRVGAGPATLLPVTAVIENNNANLSALTLSAGMLTPDFDAATTTYTAMVDNSVSSLTLTPTAAEAGASITVAGTAVASGVASGSVDLDVGPNPIAVEVTATDGSTMLTYTVTVTRAAAVPSPAARIGAVNPSRPGLSSEENLDGTILLVVLSNTNFVASTSVIENAANYRVNGLTGLTIRAVSFFPISPIGVQARVEIELAYDGTDFDTDTAYTVTVLDAVHTGTGDLTIGPGIDTTVTATVETSRLSALSLSEGMLTPTFGAGTFVYAASVANSIDDLTVTPTAAAGTTITVGSSTVSSSTVNSGEASAELALTVGANTITVAVTTPKATAQGYTLTVTREMALSFGGASTGGVTEDASTDTATGTLTVTNPNPSGGTEVVAQTDTDGTYGMFSIVAASGAWTYTLNNSAPATNALAAGETVTDVFTVVAAADPGAITDVTITITGANDAPTADAGDDQAVALSATVTLDGSASADPDTGADPANADAIASYAWTQDSGTNVTLDDATAVSPTFTAPNSAGDLVFSLLVNDGTAGSAPATVTITVTDALAATISATTPDPLTEDTLDGATLTVTLVNTTYEPTPTANQFTLAGVTGVTVSGVTRAGNTEATLTLAFDRAANDFDTNASLTVTVLEAAHTGTGDLLTAAPVAVEAVDESDVATLSDLTLSDGVSLNETFAPGTLTYTADVANDVATLTVTPTATDAGATITVDSTAVTSGMASGAIDLNAGPNTITVVVTAEDGAATQTYTLTVTRAAALALSFGGETIDAQTYTANTAIPNLTLPVATGGTAPYSYALSDVPSALAFAAATRVLSGTPDAELAATTYTYTATDSAVPPAAVTLDLVITVAAEAASSDATLAGLTLSGGATLNPVFAPATLTYTADVANDVATLTVTPTATDAGATIAVNGTAVTSGSASTAITLTAGVATDIAVLVTAEDGTTQTYNLAVTRAAATTPTAAIATPSSLTEATLDGATVTVMLTNTEYVPGVLATNLFTVTLLSGSGVTVSAAARTSAVLATLTLAYGGTGIDANTTLGITVLDAAHSGTGNLDTATIPVTATPPSLPGATFSVAENAPVATTVGTPLVPDNFPGGSQTWAIVSGNTGNDFAINPSTGQLSVAANDSINFEVTASYTLMVSLTIGAATAQATVAVTVTDVDEPPAAPAAPTVTAAAESLSVNWTAPDNNGPAITSYDVQFRTGVAAFTVASPGPGAATSLTITGLTASTLYEVQVRAVNAEGNGAYSASGSGTPLSAGAPTAAITTTAPTTLTEANLNGAMLTVTLTNATYVGTLTASQFTLTGAPGTAMISVESVTGSGTQAVLVLAYTGADLDSDLNLRVVVAAAAHTGTNPLTTAPVTVADNAAPVIVNPGSQTYVQGMLITPLMITVTDTDTPTITVRGLPTGLLFNLSQNQITGTPDATVVAMMVTITADDGVNDMVTETFTITVTSSGALSFGGATIDAQTYTVNTAITDLTLPVVTGGTGPYGYALLGMPSGLSFNAMTRVLSGTPDTEQGATSYTYTATDSALSPAAVTLSLMITVEPGSGVTGGPLEVARSEAMEMTLGAFGRSFTSGAVEVLGERFSSGAGGSQLTFGGRTLSLESLRNGQAAANAGDESDNQQPVPAAAGGHQTSVGALFAGSAFQLSLNEGNAAGVGATTLWARGSVGNYEGEPEDGFQLDGDIVSGYLGLDYRASRRTLVGVAVSHSRGDADFSSAAIADGEVETELTSILPYVQWQPHAGLSLWGLVGYGLGESEITDSGESRKTDVEMQTAALGARGKLWSGGRADVALKASALTVELESDSEQNLSSVTTRAHRLRMALAGNRHGAASARGGRFGQRFELGLRWDLGDVETGAGADLGAGVEYANPRSGTRLRLDGHYLLVHEESDFEAWEVSAEVGIAPSLWGRGVRFALQPGWDSAGARQRMVMDFTDVLGPAWRGDGLKLELYGEHAEDHEFGLEGSVRY